MGCVILADALEEAGCTNPDLLAHCRVEGPRPRALRGVLLAAGLVMSLSGAVAEQALAQVRQVLGGVWRASSLVECINRVARMQQARHRRMSQGLLDLKRLYWNGRELRTGKRRPQTPDGLLGLKLPTGDGGSCSNCLLNNCANNCPRLGLQPEKVPARQEIFRLNLMTDMDLAPIRCIRFTQAPPATKGQEV